MRIQRGTLEGVSGPRGRLPERWQQIWLWALVVLAGAYALVVLVNFRSVITAINMDSDVSIAPMIGKLVGSAPHGAVVSLGDHPWYEPLWFLHLTSGLPGYRQLWEVAPVAWSLIGIAILAWSAWHALGPWPAVLAASALLCAGTAARFMFLSFDWHGPTAVHTVFLGALIVWLAGRARTLAPWQLAAIAMLMGALSAAPAAGDKLFVVWAIVPMLVTAGLLAWRARAKAYWRLLAAAVGITVITLVVGKLLHDDMVSMGWTSTPFPVGFASPRHVVKNVALLIESYTNLGGGDFLGGGYASRVDAATFVTGALFLALLVCLPFELRRRVARSRSAPVSLDPVAARRFAYVVFWASSLAISSAVFVFSNAPVDANSARYVLAGYVALGALVPLLATRSRRWQAGVTIGVCVFALIASYQVIRNPFQPQLRFPTPQQARTLARYAESEHVTYGYTGYWDAADLTWMSEFKVKVYPVTQCNSQSLAMCPYYIGISSWYTPRHGTNSMLVIDHGIQIRSVIAPDPGDGLRSPPRTSVTSPCTSTPTTSLRGSGRRVVRSGSSCPLLRLKLVCLRMLLRPRGRRSSTWLALLFYLAVSVALFGRHVLIDPAGHCVCSGLSATGDPPAFMWALSWWPHAIAHGLNPFYSHAIWAPGGVNVATVNSIPGAALVLSPVTELAGALVSYNLLAVISPALSAFTAFALCRQVTGKTGPALIGGVIFGFGSYELEHLTQHPNLFTIFFIPLFPLLAVKRLKETISRRRFVAIIALVFIGQFLLSTELTLDVVMFGAVAFVAAYLMADEADRPRLRRLFAEVLVGGLAAAVIVSPYIWWAMVKAHLPTTDAASYPLDPLNLVIPTPITLLGGHTFTNISLHFPQSYRFPAGITEDVGYIGVALLAAFGTSS